MVLVTLLKREKGQLNLNPCCLLSYTHVNKATLQSNHSQVICENNNHSPGLSELKTLTEMACFISNGPSVSLSSEKAEQTDKSF